MAAGSLMSKGLVFIPIRFSIRFSIGGDEQMRGIFLTMFLVSACALPITNPLVKQEYFIGGWIPDIPENFLLQWSPIFEKYLTDVVGAQYQPPIRFRLIPVDFSPDNRAIDLIQAGKLDFVCKTNRC